jgi:SulP family sulfate permease
MESSHVEPPQPEPAQPEIEQPGLSELREAVANRPELLPSRATLQQDALAGLNDAIASVPDGLANGILAGVNPLYGLYAGLAGPIGGALFSSSSLMVITSTSAAALAAGQALAGLPMEARDNALFALVILVGVFQVMFGLLRLGQLIRFVSFSVMTGFLAGIAALTALSQFPTVTGYEASGGSSLARAFDVVAHLNQVELPTLAVAVFSLILAIVLPRTRLGTYGTLASIIIPSLLVVLLQWESVEIVRDVGQIPRGLPTPFLPSLSDFTPSVITGALAVALIVLVQGAGVSQSVPNPDGSRSSASRDFIAQGAGNVAAGFFRGLPVGGSLGTTAVNVLSGAQSRWSAIFAGLWMAVIVVVFPTLVSYVVMPALGALLILASVGTIKPKELQSIWEVGWSSRLASAATFLATLLLPVQVAVGIGVVLSAMLYLNESSADISIVELVRREDGRIEERRPPKQLESNKATVLDVYGHLYYAGARTLERLLPRVHGAQRPVVVLRLRGHNNVGATLIEVLSNYAERLQAVEGRLYLSGMSDAAYDQVVRSGKLRLTGPVRAYEATPIIGESTTEAVEEARSWLVRRSEEAGENGAA